MMIELEIIKGFLNKHIISYLTSRPEEIDINNVKALKYPINTLPTADQRGAKGAYGYFTHIKEYAGISRDSVINCSIKHGLYLSNFVAFEEISHNTSNIIVSSEHEKKVMESIAGINAIPIGPFIYYASDFYDENKVNMIRHRNGRTMLVFPTHSSKITNVYYDIKEFAEEICKVGKAFKTIYVCLGSNDLLMGLAKVYSKYGFKVVSAGSQSDYYFLNRQKTLIKLCDVFMTNEYTTGCAFALLYNKPVYTFRQEIILKSLNRNNRLQLNEDKKEYKDFYELSNDPGFGNLKKQIEWGRYYFGLDKVKSKNELRDILIPMMR